jgi:hypothetical protein
MMDSIRTATEEFDKEWEVLEQQHEHELNVRDIESYGTMFWYHMFLERKQMCQERQRLAMFWLEKYVELLRENKTKKLRGEVRDLQEKGVSLTDDEQG